MSTNNNIITMTDSYKLGHFLMYPENTEYVYSYFESRNGAKFNKTIFFGLQYLIKSHLVGNVVTKEKIEEAFELCKNHMGSEKIFNRKMWRHILENHGGRLPVRIKAVPEGTPVDVNNVLMTVENTDPNCAALTNHLETLLSHVWSSATVATLSYEIVKMIGYYLDSTSDNKDLLRFSLHDFGYRGVSSVESAGICGAAHLINSMGTDTIRAMEIARDYYGASLNGLAYSVPASEHSVMTAMGPEGEKKIFKMLLDTFNTGILSLVIDSYDYNRFIREYAAEFKSQILSRDGKVVFRPDSGDPNSVTLEVLQHLEEVFGSTINSKGFKVLNPKVGVLWGDGIDYDGIRGILFTMKNNKWATSNIVFGSGGGLLQKINRDTQRFAFKSSAQCRDGVWHDIFKKPIDSSKASKRGRLILTRGADGVFTTYNEHQIKEFDNPVENYLITVFENGDLKQDISFEQVRKNTGTWL